MKQIKKKRKMSDAQLEESARLFAMLAEPSRLMLLRALMDGPMTVTELVNATKMQQGNVSKHLSLLQQARFVRGKRDGNFVRYEICDFRLIQLCELMCARIQQDARTLAQKLR